MPIVDVTVVDPSGATLPESAARRLADALAVVFEAPSGTVWVRLQQLEARLYAENGTEECVYPVFLKVLHADLPPGEALAAQAAALADAAAGCLSRNPAQVHIEYAPPGRGRVAFGGRLLR